MQVHKVETQPGSVELEILIDAEQFGKAKAEVLEQFVRNVQIPGFRKGKAPRAMVERTTDPTAVRARAIERIVPGAYRDALEETGVRPYTDPDVKIVSADEDEDLRVRLLIQKQPEVKIGAIKGLELTRFTTVVEESDLENELENFRKAHSVYQDDATAVIATDDIVNIQVLVNGEEDNVIERTIHVGSYTELPAIDDDLIGLKVDDEKDIEVIYPADFEAPDLAGKSVVWHVVVTNVHRLQMPELTDEWVKQNVDMSSVEELRSAISNHMRERAAQLDLFSLQAAAVEKLVEGSEVVFPEMMLEEEGRSRYERLLRSLQRSHSTVATYAASQGMTPEALHTHIYERARIDLRQYLLFNEIAQKEGIEVTHEEIVARIEAEGLAKGQRPAIIELEKKNEDRRHGVGYDLIREKVIDLVINSAKITEGSQSLTEAKSSEASA